MKENFEKTFCNCLTTEQNIQVARIIEHVVSKYGIDIDIEEIISDAVDVLIYNVLERGVEWYVSSSPAIISLLDEYGKVEIEP